MSPVLIVLQEQLVELVRFGEHEVQLPSQLRAVVRKRDPDVRHVERQEQMVVRREFGHARIVHRELEDQSAQRMRHEGNPVDGAVHLLLQPRHLHQHLVHHRVREVVQALGGAGIAGLDENALHVGIRQRDQVLHLLHVKRIGFESVQNENDMQRLIRHPFPETILAASQDWVVLSPTGRVDAVPVLRSHVRENSLFRLGTEDFAEKRDIGVDVDGFLDLGEILTDEPIGQDGEKAFS